MWGIVFRKQERSSIVALQTKCGGPQFRSTVRPLSLGHVDLPDFEIVEVGIKYTARSRTRSREVIIVDRERFCCRE